MAVNARFCTRALLGAGLSALLIWNDAAAQATAANGQYDWRSEWGTKEGLALSRDTDGYQLPTAIAFVPRPGPGPKDPLYFVTELRGKVKVVTNDRSVYTFAQDFVRSRPEHELPDFTGETGLAGICLAPEQGYVFVTFAYQDAAAMGADSAAGQPHMASHRAASARRGAGILRNNVVRFESTPRTFSLKPTGRLAFTELFADYEAAISHQIGACQAVDDVLYVSVADGWQTAQSQKVNSLLGKVLRMTFDGRPAPGNPFYQGGDARQPAAFVWAYGFRNPFGLKAVQGRVFAADNGLQLDRFLEVLAGENYLWNGSDWSIGARADLTISPDVGPAQLDYYAGGLAELPDEYAESFFLAASSDERPGIMQLRYSLKEGRARGAPEYIVRYQGAGTQFVTGVAVGPDGLYMVPTLPDSEGRSAVLKVAFDPGHRHPYSLTHSVEPEALMEEKGCFGCHQLEGVGRTVGPPLDQEAITERSEARFSSEAYENTRAELDRLAQEPFSRYREARAELSRASGREKTRTWLIYRIMEPKFDDPNARMPNLGLSRSEATLIADHLLRERPVLERWRDGLLGLMPEPVRPVPLMYRHLLLAMVAGLILGALIHALLPRARGWLRQARHLRR